MRSMGGRRSKPEVRPGGSPESLASVGLEKRSELGSIGSQVRPSCLTFSPDPLTCPARDPSTALRARGRHAEAATPCRVAGRTARDDGTGPLWLPTKEQLTLDCGWKFVRRLHGALCRNSLCPCRSHNVRLVGGQIDLRPVACKNKRSAPATPSSESRIRSLKLERSVSAANFGLSQNNALDRFRPNITRCCPTWPNNVDPTFLQALRAINQACRNVAGT